MGLRETITLALGSHHQILQAGRPWQKSLCQAPLSRKAEARPAVLRGQGQDANRNAWIVENKLKWTSGDSSARRPFLKGRPEHPHLLFCAHKCHPIATRPLRLNNKAERVSAWGAGLWAVCQGCQAAQTSMPTELRDKRTAPVKAWKLEWCRGVEMTCLVRRQSLVCPGPSDKRPSRELCWQLSPV